MPSAGQIIKASHLPDTDGVTLTNDTPTSTTERQWGTETITFTNPGIPVRVLANVTGRITTTTAGAFQTTKVSISFDGGSTFTTGSAPIANGLDTSATGTGRATVAATHHRTGTPTGNIVIKSMVTSSAATTPAAQDGFLSAIMVAD